MKRYEFTDKQIAELESAHQAVQDPQQAFRLGILYLRAHGCTYGDICEQTGISISAAEGIVRRYRAGGIEAVLAMRAGKRQFTPEQVSEVKSAYDAAADKWMRRHLEAVYLYVQGKTYAEISVSTGFGQTTVIRLLQEYRENGLEAIVERLTKASRRKTDGQPVFTPEQAAELDNARKTATNPKTIRRLEALLQLAEGRTFEDAAATTGYSTSNIYWLKREYLKGGTASIFRMERRKKQPFIAHRHKFTPEQKAEIEAARKTAADKQTAVRLKMLWLRANGKSMPEISTATGYSINTIVCVIRQYQEGGLDAIAPKRAKKQRR
ncbi:hypothetical protein D3Z47_17145 [Lachnospiraceae bacterium]|nr:hypothetical protein [Lachnospiraceae bacterium]